MTAGYADESEYVLESLFYAGPIKLVYDIQTMLAKSRLRLCAAPCVYRIGRSPSLPR